MPTPTLAQLKQAITIAERIENLQAELASIVGGSASIASVAPTSQPASTPVAKKGKRKISAAHRAKLAVAAKARWAKLKGTAPKPAKVAPAKAPAAAAKKQGAMSPEHRAKLAAAAKKRWVAIKAGKAANPFGSRGVKSAPEAKPAARAKVKRKISPEGRAKMAAAAKKRWAKVKK